jgi:hypothetical protein
MNEKFLLLARAIQRDLQAIEKIYDLIGTPNLADETDEEKLIVLAYRLHNLYNAFENIFQNIAATFENSLDDSARWHAQLLQRMNLDVMPVRPAVIDDTAYDLLDELRRFRHVFRYAYDIKLDAQRLQLVLSKTLQLKTIYRSRIEQFLDFLRDIQTDELT